METSSKVLIPGLLSRSWSGSLNHIQIMMAVVSRTISSVTISGSLLMVRMNPRLKIKLIMDGAEQKLVSVVVER